MKSPNYNLNITLDFLSHRITEIEKLLREKPGTEELIFEKNSHNQSLKYLKFRMQHEIDTNARVLDLSDIAGHGFSEFRLMVDNESDDSNYWQEVKEIAGVEAKFCVGDKILKL